MFGLFKNNRRELEDLKYEVSRQSDIAHHYRAMAQTLTDKLERLTKKWDDLVTQVNKKGGQQFLDGPSYKDRMKQQFTDDELRSLLQLVHPDRHHGKESAVKMTQKINALRK